MTGSFFGYGMMLFALPILAGQWIGITGLQKSGRNTAWWSMSVGIVFTTLATLGQILRSLMMVFGNYQLTSGDAYIQFFALSGLTTLGSLLFASGFAIHGQQAYKAGRRIAELEGIAATQGEELHRLRSNH